MEKKEIVIDRSSPKSVEKSAHSTDRSMSPVFSGPVTGTSLSQKIDSRPASIEVVETVEEMSSSSFGDNIREEQMDAIMVEDIEELANTSKTYAVLPIVEPTQTVFFVVHWEYIPHTTFNVSTPYMGPYIYEN